MKAKYLIFDLDGTLLDSNLTIRKKTLEIIDFARKNKNYFVTIATGRSYGMALDYMKEVNPDGYAILANGNFVFDVKNNKLIATDEPLSLEVKKFSFEYLIENQNGFVLFTDNGDYFYTLADTGWNEFHDFSKRIINLKNLSRDEIWDFIKKANVYCISMFLNKETVEESKQKFSLFESKGLCKITSAAKRFIDITSGSVSKYEGFKKMCELINIDVDSTYYFGDSENDYEMICKIPNSVAMGNACSSVKDKARYVLDGSHNTDSIYDFLSQKL